VTGVNRDGLEWFREQYGVPARLGGKVICDGQPGEIRGASGPHLLVLFEGSNIARPAHPTWRMTYLPAELRGEG
jgi:hypothetical protein